MGVEKMSEERIETRAWLEKYPHGAVYPYLYREDPAWVEEFLLSFYEAGALKVELPDAPNTAKIFITVPDLVPKKLMELIVRGRPHEFWEEEPNVYRLTFWSINLHAGTSQG